MKSHLLPQQGQLPRVKICHQALRIPHKLFKPHPKAGSRVKRRPNRRKRRSAAVTYTPEKNTLQALKNARPKPTPVQAKPRKRKLQLSAKVTKTTEWYCLVCGDSYSNSAPGEEWVQCCKCLGCACVDYSVNFVCDVCAE